MFDEVLALLKQQSQFWSDGYLVFDGGPNAASGRDLTAVEAFVNRDANQAAQWGRRERLSGLNQALRGISLGEARLELHRMLKEEHRLYCHRSMDEAMLTPVIDAFFSKLRNPNCFSNSSDGGAGWHAVTPHARDSLLVFIDDFSVGYWLTTDDE
jgi:hypothetical protein